VNNNDTTAVLSPISDPAAASTTEAQPTQDAAMQTAKLAADKSGKPAPDKKRTGRMTDPKRFKIFCGTSNIALCEEVCKFVGVPVGETRLQRFADGEVYFQLLENVRGADVFVIQPTCFPVDQHLVELLMRSSVPPPGASQW